MRFVLGLKSAACLPLVSPTGRVLGVLRLGFQEPWEWTDSEKVRGAAACWAEGKGRGG